MHRIVTVGGDENRENDQKAQHFLSAANRLFGLKTFNLRAQASKIQKTA